MKKIIGRQVSRQIDRCKEKQRDKDNSDICIKNWIYLYFAD